MILHGDALVMLKDLKDNSVDAVVTDPPYGWRFMGKAWDAFDIQNSTDNNARAKSPRKDGRAVPKDSVSMFAGLYNTSLSGNKAFGTWTELWAREVFRVLKPGGHALIFCGPRTYHRMASGVEDAGFEIRDQLQWLFGSGFPKSMNVAIAIDKQSGAMKARGQAFSQAGKGERVDLQDAPSGWTEPNEHKPITDSAKQWQGWGTALKPANEPIVLARKPLSESTVAKNVLRWGCGALNIDSSRIAGPPTTHGGMRTDGAWVTNKARLDTYVESAQGRWPANLLFDETAAQMLDEQSGFLIGAGNKKESPVGKGTFGVGERLQLGKKLDNGGGASRFFYCAKSSKRERGLDNKHPTVKPLKLMEYLIRLITPPGGIVLDPFAGSGSTLVAAQNLGFKFIGIEMDEAYVAIARRRVASE